jgi:histidinol dehydrogenase
MTPLLTTIDLRGATGDLRDLLPAPELAGEGPTEAVRDILRAVRAGGDRALRELTLRFDHVEITDLRVPDAEIKAALDQIPATLRAALEAARDNIDAYHRIQLHPDGEHRDRGLTVRELRRPVDRAGLYVPGGRAPLASTVLMTAVPAREG